MMEVTTTLFMPVDVIPPTDCLPSVFALLMAQVADDAGLSASESLPSTCLGMVLLQSPPSAPAELTSNAADAESETEACPPS